jgi:hypothetical protein
MTFFASLAIAFATGYAFGLWRERRRAAGVAMIEQLLRELFEQNRRLDPQNASEPD